MSQPSWLNRPNLRDHESIVCSKMSMGPRTGSAVVPSVMSLLAVVLLQPGHLSAESIPVRYQEGSVHGFLALRTLEGKILAAGDLTQAVRGNRVVSRLVFHFKDGSVDDETAVFSQLHDFRLITDHHIQKGPSFPNPTDVSINASTGRVIVRYPDEGKEKVEDEHMNLPPDLANGIILNILKNIRTMPRRRRCLMWRLRQSPGW